VGDRRDRRRRQPVDCPEELQQATEERSQKKEVVDVLPRPVDPPADGTAGADKEDHRTERSRAMAPMRPTEYAELRSRVREVRDPETGRIRLVRGTGEIIERIVPRSEHERINREATAGDGRSFAAALAVHVRR